ncbi:hypothetical protein ABFX02_07G096800 [Erythranthe guttata]
MSVIPVLSEGYEFTRMETREAPPAHFLIKIESFSLLGTFGIDKYETREFVAGDYKWKLIIYPNGDNIVEKDSGHVSVYLAIADTSSLPKNWEVNATFSIFLYNHISGRTRRFQGMKSKWGFSKFISKESLTDPSNGYVVYDNPCVFGAEVFVVKKEAVTEYLFVKDIYIPFKRDWKIPNFSELGDQLWESGEFVAGGHKWTVGLYPKGYRKGAGSHVSIFLRNLGSERVQACYTLCIKNQVSNQHIKEITTDLFYTAPPTNSQGWSKFIELATINDPEKGYIVDDTCLLHVEISSLKLHVAQ